jgi:cholesterol transport system auxiliary component
MKNKILTILATLAVTISALLGGCATGTNSIVLYDFGPLRNMPSAPELPALPPVSIAEVGTPVWLDSPMMFYRLGYANDQQPQPYANSRWTMPPAQLFGQRLKSRMAQAGGTVLTASDGAANVPVLRIEIDEFIQSFDAPRQSAARVRVRAALFDGRRLIAQKTFANQSAAPSADAAGGVKAMANASEAVITDMMIWLTTLPSPKL